MHTSITKTLLFALLAGIFSANHQARSEDEVAAKAVKVELVKAGDNWQLQREGKPYFIKGVGITADSALAPLPAAGGNSVRLWGTEFAQKALDEAQKQGLTVAVGIWLRHEKEKGKPDFSYGDEKMVQEQLEEVKQQVMRFKDHPAVLLWGIGNEMEGYGAGNDPKIWAAVNAAAKAAKELDPNHPVMTCVAEVGGERIQSIHKYCPDVDIVGLNTYAGASSIGDRYAKNKGTKPYILTEFGPPGAWEVGKTGWGAPREPSSTTKADAYRKSYKGSIDQKPLCLGSYAFLWGRKQETTATWYGMFLKSGEKVGAVDVISEMWTGKPPAELCPAIKSFKLNGPESVAPEATFTVTLDASDPNQKPLQVQWVIQPEQTVKYSGGEEEPELPELSDLIVKSDNTHAEVRAPKEAAGYRIFAYVRNSAGAAVANIPFRVEKSK